MKIDFALLLKNKSLKIQRTEWMPAFEIYDDVVISKPFELTACAYIEQDKIYVELAAVYITTMTCSRCLIEFTTKQTLRFKEGYTPDQLEEHYPQGVLDTAELAREQIILKTPIKNVCKDDCLGLCPACGKDKNIHACDCETEKKNPYFEKLEVLLSDTDKEV